MIGQTLQTSKPEKKRPWPGYQPGHAKAVSPLATGRILGSHPLRSDERRLLLQS